MPSWIPKMQDSNNWSTKTASFPEQPGYIWVFGLAGLVAANFTALGLSTLRMLAGCPSIQPEEKYKIIQQHCGDQRSVEGRGNEIWNSYQIYEINWTHDSSRGRSRSELGGQVRSQPGFCCKAAFTNYLIPQGSSLKWFSCCAKYLPHPSLRSLRPTSRTSTQISSCFCWQVRWETYELIKPCCFIPHQHTIRITHL